MMKFWIAVIATGLALACCKGQCGFPGEPRNGSVQIALNKSSFSQKNWEMSVRAVYSCDLNHVLVVPVEERKCSEGKWIGKMPQCAETLRVTTILINGTNKDFKSGCLMLHPFTTFSLSIEKGRRLYGIVFTSSEDWPNFNAAPWGFSFWEPCGLGQGPPLQVLNVLRKQILEGRKRLLFIFDDKLTSDETETVKTIHMFANIGVLVFNIDLYAFHDKCGHPEVPVHGSVQWTPDDSIATYRCNDGYQLNSTSATIHCNNGNWNESDPSCALASRVTPSVRDNASATAPFLVPFAIACGALLLFILITISMCNRNRTSAQIKRKKSANSEANVENIALEQVEPSVDRHIYAEIYDHLPRPRLEIPAGFQGYQIPNHLLNQSA